MQDLVTKVIERQSQPGTVITSHIPDDLPLVDIDSARVEVVLHNLVANARVYGEDEVHIAAAKKDEAVICTSSSPYTRAFARSEEHTSELQSHSDLVCRLL